MKLIRSNKNGLLAGSQKYHGPIRGDIAALMRVVEVKCMSHEVNLLRPAVGLLIDVIDSSSS